MSSRWISTSLSLPSTPVWRLIVACAALTSDDLPMPRAPHRSALLAGRPRANRSVFSTRRSRTRSTPRRSLSSTRLTLATGPSVPRSARQTKASAASKSGFAGAKGASRSSASAMRLRRSAWLGSGCGMDFFYAFNSFVLWHRCGRSSKSRHGTGLRQASGCTCGSLQNWYFDNDLGGSISGP